MVLTGRYGDKRSYLTVDEGGHFTEVRGYPPAELLRGEISFDDLPEASREKVLEVYREAWGL